MPSPVPPPTRTRRQAVRSVPGALVVAAGTGALTPPTAAATLTEVARPRTRYGGTGTQASVEAIRFFGLDSGSGPTSPPPPPGACRVSDQVNAWNTGLNSNITITSTGSSTINSRSQVFTLPSGQTITSGRNAAYTPSSGQITARSMSYDALIPSGASTTIGFQATHTGDSGRPASFTLNGAMCTVA
jgi:acetylxylan esterase